MDFAVREWVSENCIYAIARDFTIELHWNRT